MRPTNHLHASGAQNSRETHAIPLKSHATAAFTLPELLVVLIIVIILAGMIMPPMTPGRPKANRIKCINNLKNLGLAYRIYATDHNDRFPWELPSSKDTNAPTHILYSNDPTTYILPITELSTPFIVKCPADKGRSEATNWTQFTRTNLSYFISPDASQIFSNSFLAGDRNITNQNGPLRPGLHTLPLTDTQRPALSALNSVGWSETIHKSQGNICMGDGSVQQLSSARLRDQLRNTGQTNHSIKLSIP